MTRTGPIRPVSAAAPRQTPGRPSSNNRRQAGRDGPLLFSQRGRPVERRWKSRRGRARAGKLGKKGRGEPEPGGGVSGDGGVAARLGRENFSSAPPAGIGAWRSTGDLAACFHGGPPDVFNLGRPSKSGPASFASCEIRHTKPENVSGKRRDLWGEGVRLCDVSYNPFVLPPNPGACR